MNDIESYLTTFKKAISSIEGKKSGNNFELGHKYCEYAQILSILGQFKESADYFRKAWEIFQSDLKNTVFCVAIYSCGVQYATTLDHLNNDLKECERVFLQLEDINPTGYHLCEYAFYLHRRKKDFDKAESYYKKALELFPDHSSVHLKYAGFLRHVRRNIAKAEEHYLLAVQVSPENADALGNYASFLHGVHQKIEEAGKYYEKAVKADDTHANNLCNYGLFLSEEKKDFQSSEKMYRRVLEITPNHVNTLYNLAVLLDTHIGRKEEAEVFYRQALDVEPRHSYALYNLAVLLEEKYAALNVFRPIREDEDDTVKLPLVEKRLETGHLYRRAAEADARDATTLADYGRFLFVRMEDHQQAEPILLSALKIDKGCEVALYHLAILFFKAKKEVEKAEQLLQMLLSKSPQHANGLLASARIYSDQVQTLITKLATSDKSKSEKLQAKKESALEMAIEMYEKAASFAKEPINVVLEFLHFISMRGNSKQKFVAIKNMSSYIDSVSNIVETTSTAGKDDSSAAEKADILAKCKLLIKELKASIN